jgi:regulator of protease activity HflC (stomatin/prohibitin superfamily)
VEAFAWFGELFEGMISVFPRVIIVRATHGGIKWVRGSKVVPLSPGWYIYWPLTTEYEVIPTGRQTHTPPKQTLTTRDGKSVSIGIVVVYRINDIHQAIGKNNWDVDATVNDVSQAAVTSVIASKTYEQLRQMVCDDVLNDELKTAAKKELSQFGVLVQQCKLTDETRCEVTKVIHDVPHLHVQTGEEE